MQSIKVTRYEKPLTVGWAGYIEPEDKSWIAFVGLDGRPLFYLNRDPATGAVVSDDPTCREDDIAAIVALPGLRTGMREDGSVPPGETPLKIGEVVMPLGERAGHWARSAPPEGSDVPADINEPQRAHNAKVLRALRAIQIVTDGETGAVSVVQENVEIAKFYGHTRGDDAMTMARRFANGLAPLTPPKLGDGSGVLAL